MRIATMLSAAVLAMGTAALAQPATPHQKKHKRADTELNSSTPLPPGQAAPQPSAGAPPSESPPESNVSNSSVPAPPAPTPEPSPEPTPQ